MFSHAFFFSLACLSIFWTMNYYSITQIFFTCVRVLDSLESRAGVGGSSLLPEVAVTLKSKKGAEPQNLENRVDREPESDKPKISRVSKQGACTGNVTTKIWKSIIWVQDEPSVGWAISWYRLGYLQLTMCWPHLNKNLGSMDTYYMDVFILMCSIWLSNCSSRWLS